MEGLLATTSYKTSLKESSKWVNASHVTNLNPLLFSKAAQESVLSDD